MNLSELILALGDYTITLSSGDAKKISIKGCKMLLASQKSFSPEILYYWPHESPPPLPKEVEITLLVENRKAFPKDYLEAENVNLIISDSYPSALIYNQIVEALNEDMLIVRSSQRLMEALFSDLGLQYLVDIMYDITGHPIYIVDTSYRYLAISNQEHSKQVDSPLLAKETEYGFIVDEGIQYINKKRLDELVRKSERPFYFENDILGGGSLIDIVKVHNVEVGHVMMFQMDKPFTRFDRVLLSRLASMVSLELQKSSFFKANRGVMYSFFLADLLQNNTINYKSIHHRLQVLGFTLREKLYVLTVKLANNNPKNESFLETIANQLHWLLVGSMYVVFENQVVMLISRDSKGITEYELTELNDYLAENLLVAGLSSEFDNIKEIKLHYNHTQVCAALGEEHFAQPKAYHYEDMIIMHMLSICEKEESLLSFCHPQLIKLLEYDKEKNTEFTNTFYQYLSCSQNSTNAAEILFIHKNTLLYRIKKIKDILQTDLGNGDILMRFHMSFHILKYLKMF